MTKNINRKTSSLILFSIFSFFLFLNFVSAEVNTNDVDDVFKVNDVIEYTKVCINNGTYCTSAATCNYTFYNLDSSVRLNNVQATNVGADGSSIWQYNISFQDTGIYRIDMVCTDTTGSGAETFYAQVTGSGSNDSYAFYILIIILSFGVIVLGFFLQDPPITILGTLGLYFLGLYILFNGIAGVKDLTTTWAIGIITLAVAGYISIRSAMELMGN